MNTLQRKRNPRPSAGFTLVEIAVAMPIIALAIGMFIQMLSAGSNLRRTSHENWNASNAIQTVLEEMRNCDFDDLFVLYNDHPFDDPTGAGTAPGAHFDVEGMAPLASDPDGRVGRVVLPTHNAGTTVAPIWQLREDQTNAALGLPRDLSGDSIVDLNDHAGDYSLLPVQVELQWQSTFGPRLVRIQTILTELR